MTKEDGRISRTIECKVGKTQISSITLDTGHEKKILEEIKKRDNYLSKSKVVEWALDDFFTAHGFEIITDRREREGQADVLLLTSIKLSKHKGHKLYNKEDQFSGGKLIPESSEFLIIDVLDGCYVLKLKGTNKTTRISKNSRRYQTEKQREFIESYLEGLKP